MERGTVEWNSETMEWTVEYRIVINDPVPFLLI